eukprot:1768517-Pyramimonas_sp.AAC.1
MKSLLSQRRASPSWRGKSAILRGNACTGAPGPMIMSWRIGRRIWGGEGMRRRSPPGGWRLPRRWPSCAGRMWTTARNAA